MPTPNPLSDSGAVELAQNVFDILGDDFNLPTVDLNTAEYSLPDQTGVLYNSVSKLTNEDLTTGVVGGSGTFDIIMSSMKEHLSEQFELNRITGDQYARAYIELTTAGLSSSVQYLLGRDQAYWAAILAQMQARRAEIDAVNSAVQLEISKAQLAIAFFEAQRSEADYAMSKMGLANADVEFELKLSQLAQSDFTVNSLMPAQLAQLTYQTNSVLPAQVAQTTYQTGNILPEQKRQLAYQTDYVMKTQYDQGNYTFTQMMPVQKSSLDKDILIKAYQLSDVLPAAVALSEEQTEVAHSQTSDTRLNGVTPVTGSVGKQKQLYDQQIDSYIKDAQYKAAKVYSDAWITQKTIDEGTDPPAEFSLNKISDVLQSLRTNNNLG
jgi:hypothetical protein